MRHHEKSGRVGISHGNRRFRGAMHGSITPRLVVPGGAPADKIPEPASQRRPTGYLLPLLITWLEAAVHSRSARLLAKKLRFFSRKELSGVKLANELFHGGNIPRQLVNQVGCPAAAAAAAYSTPFIQIENGEGGGWGGVGFRSPPGSIQTCPRGHASTRHSRHVISLYQI